MKCTKVAFSKKIAGSTLKANKHHPKQYRKECRSYYCQQCNAWHLTSMENKTPPQATDVKLIERERWEKLLNNKEN